MGCVDPSHPNEGSVPELTPLSSSQASNSPRNGDCLLSRGSFSFFFCLAAWTMYSVHFYLLQACCGALLSLYPGDLRPSGLRESAALTHSQSNVHRPTLYFPLLSSPRSTHSSPRKMPISKKDRIQRFVCAAPNGSWLPLPSTHTSLIACFLCGSSLPLPSLPISEHKKLDAYVPPPFPSPFFLHFFLVDGPR